MRCLVNWLDDWFLARIFQSDETPVRCWIQAANDSKYESMGFTRGGGGHPADLHYYKSFENDPGFRYFSEIKYKGHPVGLSSIHPDAIPREISVHSGVTPPDAEDWKLKPRDGFDRYLKIDELEMKEVSPPDWNEVE